MILVDTSVWVDAFNSTSAPAARELRRLITDSEPIAVTGVVVAEVLQGVTRDVKLIEQYLSAWDLLEPAGLSTYREAAAIFRLARATGFTVTTIDTVIAAVALEHGASVFTLDKDFVRIAKLTNLALYSPPS